MKNELTVVVLGIKGAGKTSLIRRFADDYYEDYESFSIDDKIRNINLNGQSYEFTLVESHSEHRRLTMDRYPIQRSSNYIVCYDTTNKKSFEAVRGYLRDIDRYNSKERPVIILVGTKCDVPKREVNLLEVENLAREYGLSSFVVSAKYGTAIDQPFEAIINERVKRVQAANPGFAEIKENLLKRLDAYIERVDSYNKNYNKGFWITLFGTRGLNRQANYLLAKSLKDALLDIDSLKDAQNLFEGGAITTRRDELSASIFGQLRIGDHGINSKELKNIIAYAQTECVPSSGKAPSPIC